MPSAATMTRPVYRFAPSPNGYLHLGHAYSALLNADLAAAAGGRLLLRMEDIDPSRCRPAFAAAIEEDLAWLGIAWERPVRRQSQHLGDYAAALDRMQRQGLLYPSFSTRAEIAARVAEREAMGIAWGRDPDGAPLYPGCAAEMPSAERQRRMADGQPFALRVDMAAAIARAGDLDWVEEGHGPMGECGRVSARPGDWGDVIIGRKETPTSYHLSVTLDDAAQGVTHVVRGEDLFWSTSVHRLLQVVLQLPTPVYRHHALVRDADNRKLSKSTAATSLRALRAQGMTPDDIRGLVGLSRR